MLNGKSTLLGKWQKMLHVKNTPNFQQNELFLFKDTD